MTELIDEALSTLELSLDRNIDVMERVIDEDENVNILDALVELSNYNTHLIDVIIRTLASRDSNLEEWFGEEYANGADRIVKELCKRITNRKE